VLKNLAQMIDGLDDCSKTAHAIKLIIMMQENEEKRDSKFYTEWKDSLNDYITAYFGAHG